MSTATATATRPRAMVVDELWRGLDGVDALSGPRGGPLSRTTKLILDPLVIRPMQHPLCAGPLLTPDGVQQLTELLNAAAERLRATAAWFTLLKQTRRALRITDGNPQDLYFQRSYELACAHGEPDGEQAARTVALMLREVHAPRAGRTVDALEDHLREPARAAELTGRIALAWARRPTAARPADLAAIRRLLDECATPGDDDLFDRLIADDCGTHAGIALWYNDSAAHSAGLTEHPRPTAPELGRSAATATLAAPFDRTVFERVFTALQTSSDRTDLPPVADLVDAEIARSCAPWALLAEPLRLAATAGAELAAGLNPLGGAAGETEAHRLVNRRWQREAYVQRARRGALRVVDDNGSATGKLAEIATDLARPGRSYVRRLWVRLHGRDVRASGIADTGELWDLLDGVARSVALDHRARVRQALRLAYVDVPAGAAG